MHPPLTMQASMQTFKYYQMMHLENTDTQTMLSVKAYTMAFWVNYCVLLQADFNLSTVSD